MTTGVKHSEIVDSRYIAKVLFLSIISVNFGNTYDCLWLGILFALFFAVTGFLNATSRREFSKRPKYKKWLAYGAIAPLALYWVMTPSVEGGVNPVMVFIPGLYFLWLAALQERSRGNGGYETFVVFDGMTVLLLGLFMAPRGATIAGAIALTLVIFANSRRKTALYKYLLFALLFLGLGGISYGGWRYWRSHRDQHNAEWATDYEQKIRIMGFDPVAALGSFHSNYNSKYNNQVVLRVWDTLAPQYLKAASYEKYIAGIWKLPQKPRKILTPAYYQIDYAVLEVTDSITKKIDSISGIKKTRQVWVQSTLDNFGFVFAPYDAVGFAAKDIDSLRYFSGGMVDGLGNKGKRSDWYYFTCNQVSSVNDSNCKVTDSLMVPDENDLLIGNRYLPFIDSVIDAMGLNPSPNSTIDSKNSSPHSSIISNAQSNEKILQQISNYFISNFTYTLQIPGLNRWQRTAPNNDPLKIFWREKKGFCEYYATLAVLALRRLGIPARYATGFIHPETEKDRPYAVFRRKNSHAWAEVFISGHWMVFDPTPPTFIATGTTPSWISLKWESIQGRAARIMHALKEGEWRKAVDNWQTYSQNFVSSPIPYILLTILIAFLLSRIFRNALHNHHKTIHTSANALIWSKKLHKAEFSLLRSGYRRESGETVGNFLKRIEESLEQSKTNTSDSKEKQNKSLKEPLQLLHDYEANRWRHQKK